VPNDVHPYLFAKVPTTLQLVFEKTGTALGLVTHNIELGVHPVDSFRFFTHDTTFDASRSGWDSCRSALKYCAFTARDGSTMARTLLVLNSATSRYELQDLYTTALTKRTDEITPANTHVRMITTFADTNGPPGGVLKLDLSSVTTYTQPFTIFGMRESSPNSTSKPSILYLTETGQSKLVVRSPGTELQLACTLPASCRIIYQYAGGLTGGGVLTVLNSDGSSVATCTHSMPNFGEATRTPDLASGSTSNGVAIFHHCVARAELVVSPNTQGNLQFTAAQLTALMAWAGASSS
jgi:hypothetical protein